MNNKLINNIQNSNLKHADKMLLINLLKKKDNDNFLKQFFRLLSMSKDLLDCFDLDTLL